MKKLLLFLSLLMLGTLFSFGQISTSQNMTINRVAGRFWINGTGAQIRWYNTTLTEGTGTLTLAGGGLNLGSNDLLGSGSLGSLASPFLKGWFTDLDIAGTLDLPASLIWNGTPILISPEELNYSDGLTGPIQAQINSISGGVTYNPVFTGLTTNEKIKVGATGIEIDGITNTGTGYSITSNGVAQSPDIPSPNRITLPDALTILGIGASTDEWQLAMTAFGDSTKAQTLGTKRAEFGDVHSMLDGREEFITVYIKTAGTITGVRVFMSTTGNFTADNTNGAALYTVSAGTWTKVAESSNSGNHWKHTQYTFCNIPFATPYSAAVGVYKVCLLYNNSAETAAPRLRSGLSAALIMGSGLYNSEKIASSVGAKTAFDATINASSTSGSNDFIWVVLY